MNFFLPFRCFSAVTSPYSVSGEVTAGCVLKQRADYLGNPLQGLPSSSFFLSFYLSIFFIPEAISAVTYPIAEFILLAHVS